VVTAVDSNVIFDLVTGDPAFGRASIQALQLCSAEGQLIASDVVWAEVAAYVSPAGAARQMLQEWRVEYSPVGIDAAFEAGSAWKSYRQRGGQRTRLIADFLVGARALCQADRLLTRDRGFYRAYFGGLSILDPSKRA
jgi:predicted nucleic acid-binding protein